MPLGSPQASVGVGLGVGALVLGVYNMSLPSAADIRANDPDNEDLMRAERTATWVSAGLVTGISLMTQDPTVFVIGGGAMVAIAWMYRHANHVNPLSGVAVPKPLSLVPGSITESPVSNDVIYVDENVQG